VEVLLQYTTITYGKNFSPIFFGASIFSPTRRTFFFGSSKLFERTLNFDPSSRANLIFFEFQVNLLDVAKNHLESTGAGIVLGGFMAPSGDSFLRAKLKKKPQEAPNFISGEDRCNMVDLMLEKSSWIVCDRYESFHDIRASEAKSHLDAMIAEFYLTQGVPVTVLGVCGIDALSNIKSQATIKANLFIVNRKQDDGSDPHSIVRQHHLRDHIQVVWAPDWDKCEISSSALRRLWAQKEDISSITSPEVIECTFFLVLKDLIDSNTNFGARYEAERDKFCVCTQGNKAKDRHHRTADQLHRRIQSVPAHFLHTNVRYTQKYICSMDTRIRAFWSANGRRLRSFWRLLS
jgi:nicotinic acid mononucleotide adenylyltransferase